MIKALEIRLNSKEHIKFCKAIDKHLKKRKMNNQDLAEALGVSVKSIYNFRHDTTRNPSKYLAAKIANELEIKPEEYKVKGGFLTILIPLVISAMIIPFKVRATTPTPTIEVEPIDVYSEVYGIDNGTDFVPGYYPTFIDEDIPLSVEEQNLIKGICERKELSYELVMAIIEHESRYEKNAYNPNGHYKGLMQIGPHFKVENPYDVEQNVEAGTDYLVALFKEYTDDGYVLDKYSGNPYAQSNYEKGHLSKYSREVLERAKELEVEHGK